jgi:pimeloyl-ACP methyl ester carboxylesterase
VATRRGSRKLTYLLFLFLFVVVAILAIRQPADAHLRAAAVLMRLNDPSAHGFIANFVGHPFREEPGSALTAQGPLKFRLYIPADGAHSGGIVLLHGVHHLGMDDPRLKNLSRALAGAGVEVMTPELQDLADYRVTPRTVDVIGSSAVILSTRMNRPVGLIGLSFAGGLSLMAATRPEYKDNIRFVLAVGAHEDMSRVARFFASNVVTNPNGTESRSPAHEYGMLVLAYSHMEEFFPAQDVATAREALREWLWEEPQAMKTAETLSPAGKQEFDLLLHHHEQLQQAFLDEITRHRAEMDAISPRGKLAGLSVDTYLLHGASDNIVPPAETLWLARDVPKRALKRVLISKALTHVDAGNGEPSRDKWALVHFLALVLEDAAQLKASKDGY